MQNWQQGEEIERTRGTRAVLRRSGARHVHELIDGVGPGRLQQLARDEHTGHAEQLELLAREVDLGEAALQGVEESGRKEG